MGAAACLAVGCYQPHRLADDFGSYTGSAVASGDGGTKDGGHDSHHSGSSGDGDTSSSGDGDTSHSSGDGDTSSSGDGDHSVLVDAGHAETDAGHTPPPPPHPTTLDFSVLTVELGGRFAPRNIGAIWVEDSSGSFVKTLELWARTRERYLDAFLNASNGDTTDAVTSATLNSHRTHSVTWDLTDTNGSTVPDGSYRIRVEMTDDNGTGENTTVNFDKGATPQSLTPSDGSYFVNMSLEYR